MQKHHLLRVPGSLPRPMPPQDNTRGSDTTEWSTLPGEGAPPTLGGGLGLGVQHTHTQGPGSTHTGCGTLSAYLPLCASVSPSIDRPVILNRESFYLPGNTCQCLETILFVISWEGVTGTQGVEARDAPKHPTKRRTALTTKTPPAQTLIKYSWKELSPPLAL